MSLSARDLVPILMIIASVWALFGLVQPRYETIKALRAEKQQYEDTLEKANEATRIMRETLLAEYNSISQDDWKKLDKMLPPRADGIQLARDMDGLAKVFGIKLNGFSFSEEEGTPDTALSVGLPLPPNADTIDGEEADPVVQAPIQIPTAAVPQLKKLKLSFDFQASYPDFTRFLREIEKSLELSDVRSITLSRSGSPGTSEEDEAPSENIYAISLEIDTYWID